MTAQTDLKKGSIGEVFRVSLKLGLTSFGGPVAHIGYFRDEYVKRKQWLDEQNYADLVALCQFLPGPASSQVGMSIGILRAGLLGGIASWAGFTLPSAIALMLFAMIVRSYELTHAGWLHGLMLVSVAVVAQAVWGMARSLAPDRTRGTIAVLSAIATLAWPAAYTQLILIAAAAVFGRLFLPQAASTEVTSSAPVLSKRIAVLAWVVFGGLLIGLPILRQWFPSHGLALFDSFFRVGSLVFGGGHVVLPMLQAEVVPTGWITDSQFLAGYGAAQAVPGPLFTLSAYLGAVINGWSGAVIALLAMFLPSYLLIVGALPLWGAIRRRPKFQAALQGINAAVVGILLAALFNPVWTSTIHNAYDFSLALAAFALLVLWKLPPWIVVVLAAVGGAVLSALTAL
ncbi:chromate efflux transporter [Paenibacillus sp. GCM10027628]|uniref:chromate efflux transporter n=1 Tax=Paenibacillus sp. GCM10027628 TaxID=3273413 RepID=UPI0036377F75